MIAVITPSGAFLYEMSENESDVCAETKGFLDDKAADRDRKSTRLNSSHEIPSRMPSSA